MDESLFEHYRRQAIEYSDRAQPPAADSGAAFLASHTGRGSLRIQLSTGGMSYPVEGADIEVFRLSDDIKRVYFRKTTDSSGIAEDMTFPALPKASSLSSETAAESGTVYSVTIFHPAFSPQISTEVNIYDGVETLLPIELVPSIQR